MTGWYLTSVGKMRHEAVHNDVSTSSVIIDRKSAFMTPKMQTQTESVAEWRVRCDAVLCVLFAHARAPTASIAVHLRGLHGVADATHPTA